jgi:hypothetical protein
MNRLPFNIPDRSKPLVPEALPWFAHTPFWSRFTTTEQVRANQLMGLVINELCLSLELGLIRVGMGAAMTTRQVGRDRRLQQRLDGLFADETRHAHWFTTFNQTFAPELYGQNGFHFLAPSRAICRLGTALAHLPGAWHISAWLVLAIEEWACGLADRIEREPLGPLGPRDAAFVALHRAHRREELRHVPIDAELIAASRTTIPRHLQPWTVRLVHTCLLQIMRPRRAAPRLVAQFVREFPRWRAEQPAMTAAVKSVGAQTDYWNRDAIGAVTPLTVATAAAWGWSWPRAQVVGNE